MPRNHLTLVSRILAEISDVDEKWHETFLGFTPPKGFEFIDDAARDDHWELISQHITAMKIALQYLNGEMLNDAFGICTKKLQCALRPSQLRQPTPDEPMPPVKQKQWGRHHQDYDYFPKTGDGDESEDGNEENEVSRQVNNLIVDKSDYESNTDESQLSVQLVFRDID